MPNDEPFPAEAARDLLGLARSLYVAFGKMGPAYETQRTKLAAIGSKLSRAIDKARKGGPGTWNQNTAWLMAEEAAKDLGELVDVYFPARQLIKATGDRISRKR
jgi:hypothetical protein